MKTVDEVRVAVFGFNAFAMLFVVEDVGLLRWAGCLGWALAAYWAWRSYRL